MSKNTIVLFLVYIFSVIIILAYLAYVVIHEKEKANTVNIIKDSSNRNYKHLITNTYKLKGLEIASADFDSAYNWEDAKNICKGLGEGWRLPDINELKLLFENRKKIGGFKPEKYWTGDEYSQNVAAGEMLFNYQGFTDVSPIGSKLNVRAVRTIK